jgi:uncharacterized damage-inducible protein DinB
MECIMTKTVEPMLNEFRQEAAITRRVLDKVPADKLSWQPHPKSMSLGQLAIHIANVPGRLSYILQQDQFEVDPKAFVPAPPKDMAEVNKTFDESCKTAEDFLGGLSEQSACKEFNLMVGGKPAISAPRIALVRSIMMNHLYHHRGQLSVYLRLLDVPVPAIYGRSADENPFA